MVGGALGRVLGQGGVLLGVLDGLGRLPWLGGFLACALGPGALAPGPLARDPWPGGPLAPGALGLGGPWPGGPLARGALGPGGPWPGAGNVKKPPKSRN